MVTPEWLAACPVTHMGLFRHVNGRPTSQPTPAEVQAATIFPLYSTSVGLRSTDMSTRGSPSTTTRSPGAPGAIRLTRPSRPSRSAPPEVAARSTRFRRAAQLGHGDQFLP